MVAQVEENLRRLPPEVRSVVEGCWGLYEELHGRRSVFEGGG